MQDFTKDFKRIKKELDECEKPLIFFDDDPDGLSSFLILYRYAQKGKGIIVKSTPKLTEVDAKKAEEYGADKVFAVDLPVVGQDFVDALHVPFIYVDHHVPPDLKGVEFYFNPRTYEESLYYPASLICYNVVKQDIWIAAVGVTGDFLYPPFMEEFKKQYPGYAGESSDVEDCLFETKLGKLIQIFSMILKGPTNKVMQCVKILTRIEHPDEIMDQTTPRGKFVWKYAQQHIKLYNELLKDAVERYDERDSLLVFTYPGNKLSLTSDVALELIHKFPEKVVIVAREKNGEMKTSIRARGKNIRDVLEIAIHGLDAYGGGHEYACGANVKKEDFEEFLDSFRKNL